MSEHSPDFETYDEEWRRVFETEVQAKLKEWGIDPEDRDEQATDTGASQRSDDEPTG